MLPAWSIRLTVHEFGLSTSGARTGAFRIFAITSGVRYFAHASPPPDTNKVPDFEDELEARAAGGLAAVSAPLFVQAAAHATRSERQSCSLRDIRVSPENEEEVSRPAVISALRPGHATRHYRSTVACSIGRVVLRLLASDSIVIAEVGHCPTNSPSAGDHSCSSFAANALCSASISMILGASAVHTPQPTHFSRFTERRIRR